ncbi:MAG: hypothetical protein Q8M03_03485 [Legionella sp.]|nr:hypothetical protein [Legionella sp.]
MKAYNETEALIRAWQRKISSVTTKRDELKKELLAILENPDAIFLRRLNNFTERQKMLLSEKHQQGRVWKPHFNWFFALLSPFFSLFKLSRPQSGSKLRMALEKESAPTFELLSLGDYAACKGQEIPEDSNFEDAIFSESTDALADLKLRFSRLNPATSDSDFKQAIERLYALKYRLNPFLYQHLLKILYTNLPEKTAPYFYKIYQEEHYDTPAQQDYIELHMLARTVMDNFVINRQDIHVHMHSILYLLISLSVSEKKIYSTFQQQDPVKKLLDSWDTSFDHFATFYQHLIDSIRSVDELNVRQAQEKVSTQSNAQEGLTHTLRNIFTKFSPRIHPLLHHVARLSLEQLLLDFNKANKSLKENESRDLSWIPGHHGFDTIEFIATKIIKTKPIKRLDDVEDQQKLLDPMIYAPIIPADMQYAEKCAIELILSQSIEKINCRHRAEHLRDNAEIPLSETAISWITSRVSHVAPKRRPSLQRIFDIEKEPPPKKDSKVWVRAKSQSSGCASRIGFYRERLSSTDTSPISEVRGHPSHDR